MAPDETKALDKSAAAVFRRFADLPDRDQLQVYRAIGEYLAARGPSVALDKALVAQAESVAAILRVAQHLGVTDPTELHNQAFNDTPAEIRDGWTAARVIKAHGTWNAAKAVAAGERAVPTARQRSIRRGRRTELPITDDYIASVRDWLETNPPSVGRRDYDEWALEQNAARRGDELRRPAGVTIGFKFALSWPLVLEVARRERSLAAAQQVHQEQRDKRSTGEFVSSVDIRTITGRTAHDVRSLVQQGDFPVCVLELAGRRYWLRSDVDAFLAGKPFPKRKLNELNGRYVEIHEAAKIVGLQPGSIRIDRGGPVPRYRGGRLIWSKDDLLAWRDKRARDQEARRRGKGSDCEA